MDYIVYTKRLLLLFWIYLTACVEHLDSFVTSGQFCHDMIPNMITDLPGQTPAPRQIGHLYAIKATAIAQRYYRPGDSLKVYVEGDFVGLILQARKTDGGEIIGQWISLPNAMETVNCTKKFHDDTVAFAGTEPVNNVYFQWTAPLSLHEPIEFIGTFVNEDLEYWTNVTSHILQAQGVDTSNKKKSFLDEPIFTLIAILGIYVGMYTVFSLLLI